LSKDKLVEIPVTIFHPPDSRLKNQTVNTRRGSSIFFSGEITLVEGKLYLELHNFSFLRGHQSQASTKSSSLPWASSTSASSSPSMQMNNALLIHEQQQKQQKNLPETSTKRKSFYPNKIVKLSDIATSALINAEVNDHNKANDQNEKVIDLDDEATEEIHDDKLSENNNSHVETVKELDFVFNAMQIIISNIY